MNNDLLNDIPKQFLKNYKPDLLKDVKINSVDIKENKKQENNSFDNILIILVLMIIFDII